MGRSVSYPSGALVAFTHIEDDMDYHDFQDMLESEREYAISLWPSLYEADHWRGREDHVIATNSLVEFGISEYCGLVAYWLVPREDLEPSLEAFAQRWIDQVAPRFLRTFGTLRKIGTFSNGEAVFERIAA